ncbi:2-C-methyl-D-erythritol 4-phosphate cytidylyltransferase [Aquabacterium sp. OR-4]|uniref:2-C-methyl-D-erythritol 4-phosphate cytidylyltransferase n=1 Tax=Aquabacterium sp. OR-4 TaxID=2978127 RepID=UPI0028CAE184|nr:2-C-methyl-D-erythritol 4-phosphate cytidylyltransferase [Aquabacterium sp. OR-4]MDT7834839.1 2-C-methyl-D-erythritol 4-phosphate cytidylyltransferase [Aquabacterium sp. OR-4]
MTPRCFALVPCAGTGSRSGSFVPKQYVALAGLPVVAHTLAALAQVERIAATLVVLAPDDEQFEDEVPGFGQGEQAERAWIARVGGDSRAATVLAGLAELRARGAQPHDWVLVHDAARCLVRPAWIERLLATCWHDEVGGLLALPLADTLKACDASGDRVAATIGREGKWAAQTPQMFRLGLLEPALRQALEAGPAGSAITDESSAVEALGHAPRLVRGDLENLKITYQPDFGLAERLLATGRRGTELRPMVPAREFMLAQEFYTDMGFVREFSRGQLAGFRLGNSAFLLQDFHDEGLASNLVLHLTLADLDDFWARLQREGLAERYGVRVEPPQLRPWGLKDMTVTDPSGVLWRIAQRMEVVE